MVAARADLSHLDPHVGARLPLQALQPMACYVYQTVGELGEVVVGKEAFKRGQRGGVAAIHLGACRAQYNHFSRVKCALCSAFPLDRNAKK